MMKYISEVFLTRSYVEEEFWLKFLYGVSRLNGNFKKWSIYIYIDKNVVRYFIETKRKIPSIIQDLSDFMIKKLDENIKEKQNIFFGNFYFVTNKEKSVLEIYDKNEVKHNQKLKIVKINIFPFTKKYFRFSTVLFFETEKNNLMRRKALFSIPQQLLSIDFSKYNRFFYKKEATKFLDIQKTLHLFKNQKDNALLKVNTFPYLTEDYYLHLNEYDFDKHSMIIGSSGTGKSKLISSLVMNISSNMDYINKYKIIVIDPHDEIKNDIGGLDSSQIINFENKQRSINLFNKEDNNLMVTTELILSLFQTLMAEQYNSKLERVLRYSISLLTTLGLMNFQNLRKLINEVDYRNKLLRNDLPESITDFFAMDFNNLRTTSYQEAISPILSFIDEIELLPALKDNKSNKELKDVLNDHFLTIISLNQSKIGMKAVKTISGFIMQQILQLVQSHTFDEHIILIVDEVSLLENPILNRFLAESRKYNLSLILAQQYFNQISQSLQKGIFANVVNYYIFRISKEDARILDGNIRMDIPVKNSAITRFKILTELKNRECIVRIGAQERVYPAFQAKTLDFYPLPQRVNQILTTDFLYENEGENDANKNAKSEEISFSIGETISLKDIMQSQSTARRRYEQFEH